MVVSHQIRQRYDETSAYLPQLRNFVRELLEPYCEEMHFGFVDRIKEVESLAEKLESGRLRTWDEVDDLYGATIVVPSILEEPNAIAGLRSRFEEVRFRARSSTRTPPDVFRFDSPRFIGRLKPTREREGSPFEGLLFEVQVRTAFEHAWSTATHALTYKSDHVDWKRQRLAAALRATVEQIDLSIAGFEETAVRVLPGVWPESETKHQILTRYRALFDRAQLPTEVAPRTWNRFVDNIYDLCTAEAQRQKARGRPTPREIEAVVNEALAAFESWANATQVDQVPRSLSLYQTTLGVLTQRRVLNSGLSLSVFGLEDVASVFPEVVGLGLTTG